MTSLKMNDLVALVVAALAAVFLLANLVFKRKHSNLDYKTSPSITSLLAFQHEAAEKGKRLTFGLGEGFSDQSISIGGIVGLSVWRDAARRAVFNDQPSQAVSGSGALAVVGQMVLRGVYKDAIAIELFKSEQVLLGGVTNASSLAGLVPEVNQESNLAVAMIGGFSPLAALAVNLSAWKQLPVIAMADTLPAQAAFFAATPLAALGEDYYGAELILSKPSSASAQLRAQDWLRVVAIIALIIGALLKLTGIMP